MALRIGEKGKILGVLTDWDLATVKELGEHHGDRRTGTIPFMAIDILCEDFWKGKIPRMYRHELEGFIWVLPWVLFQFQDKQYTPHGIFKTWIDIKYSTVQSAKRSFYIEFGSLVPDFTPGEAWQEQWPLVPYTMYTLNLLTTLRQHLARKLYPGDRDPTIRRWIQLPDTKGFVTNQLEYLVAWKNIARSLPPKMADLCKEDVDLDVDINDDAMFEQSYLDLFAEPDSL
jgi:hypothetical protein